MLTLVFFRRFGATLALLCLILVSCTLKPIKNFDGNQTSLHIDKQSTDGIIYNTEDLEPGKCILRITGMVNGTANFEDQSIDGSFATFIYDGGAVQAKRIYDGEFSAPILARQCDNGLDPIGFQLTIGEWRQYIKLTGTDLDLVIQLQSAPEKVENVPEHEVILGKISGFIRKDGQQVPDNTEVKVYVAGLQQTVFTHDGVYTATTIGDLSSTIETYLPITIKIESTEVNLIPSLRHIVQDINLP